MKYLLDTNVWIQCLKNPVGVAAQRIKNTTKKTRDANHDGTRH